MRNARRPSSHFRSTAPTRTGLNETSELSWRASLRSGDVSAKWFVNPSASGRIYLPRLLGGRGFRDRNRLDKVSGSQRASAMNNRRPAWEINRGLKIQNSASTVPTEGDSKHPVFNGLLQPRNPHDPVHVLGRFVHATCPTNQRTSARLRSPPYRG
jgi:hypothetical protein